MKDILPAAVGNDTERDWLLPEPAKRDAPSSPSSGSTHVHRARALLENDNERAGLGVDTALRDAHNPLVAAGAGLLARTLRVRQLQKAPDISTLSRRYEKGLYRFTRNLLRAGIKPQDVAYARYMLCAAADEAVTTAAWGPASGWAGNSLASRFHQNSVGGEDFFAHLQHCMRAPEQHLWLLELMYLCLMTGFVGKYGVSQYQADALVVIHHELYDAIQRLRGEVDRSVSPDSLPEADLPRPVQTRLHTGLNTGLLGGFLAVALAVAYGCFDTVLNAQRKDAMGYFTQAEHSEGFTR